MSKDAIRQRDCVNLAAPKSDGLLLRERDDDWFFDVVVSKVIVGVPVALNGSDALVVLSSGCEVLRSIRKVRSYFEKWITSP